MKKRIISIVFAIAAIVATAGGVYAPVWASEDAGAGMSLTTGQQAANTGATSKSFDPADMVKNVVNIAMYIIAIVAVAMIIWGGIQYMISSGDSGKVKTAKNTIIYGCIGLVIAILSYAIVNFVTTKVTNLGGNATEGGYIQGINLEV